MKIGILALLATAGLASSVLASTVSTTTFQSVTFTNKNSVDAVGDADNARDSFVASFSGNINAVRVTGQLTEINVGTFANEARVRFSAGAGSAFANRDVQASAVGNYTGSIAVGPTVVTIASTSITSGGIVNLEWFESVQDGTAGLAEQRWDTVTYDLQGALITNGNFALGALNPNGVQTITAGSNVAGGLDFYSMSIPAGVNPAGYLSILTRQTAGAALYDSEIALYDSAGNLVGDDDDGAALNFYSQMSFGATDPFTTGLTILPGADGLTLAGGNYTIVVGGFNTIFGATIGAITPGAAAGAYDLGIAYNIPAPSAAALMGLGLVVAGRRRR